MKPLLTALSLGLLTCLPVALPAAAQSLTEMPATGEILPGWQQPDGTRMAAIRITLAPGWKTYWRSPGDAGIPPQFDWSRSGNLGGVNVIWPAPQIYPQNGMRTIGYKNELVLPITIAARNAGKPVKLRTTLDIGVCKDICVPFKIKLKATLAETSTKPTPAIAAALAAQPYSAQEAGVRAATCALVPIEDGLQLTARLTLPSAGGQEVVVVEAGQPGIWVSETKTSRSGGTLTATGDMIASNGKAMVIDRSKIVLTVLGKNKAVEIKGCTPG